MCVGKPLKLSQLNLKTRSMTLNLLLCWNGSERCSNVEIVYSKGENYLTCWTSRPVDEVNETFGVDLRKCSIISTSYEARGDRILLLPFAVNPLSRSNRGVYKEYFL